MATLHMGGALMRGAPKPVLWRGALDPRWFQLAFLCSLLLFGALARDFALTLEQVVLTFAVGLGAQAAWQHGLRLPGRYSASAYLSAGVTCLGISILVRADAAWVHPLLAALAMSSKYLVRAGRGKQRSHILNPANLAAAAVVFGCPHAWLSPGQWGSAHLLALWVVGLGGIVTQRAQRVETSVAFLATWMVLSGARLFYLGYATNPGLDMWLQQSSGGALLLFAFFMITDPMTTPARRAARIVYAVAVAALAFYWQFILFRSSGPVVALFFACWLVPLINRLWPAARFSWQVSTQTGPGSQGAERAQAVRAPHSSASA